MEEPTRWMEKLADLKMLSLYVEVHCPEILSAEVRARFENISYRPSLNKKKSETTLRVFQKKLSLVNKLKTQGWRRKMELKRKVPSSVQIEK